MIFVIPNAAMGQEQGKTTMSEPSFAENSAQHPISIKNRFLLYENNYLRCINNLLSEISQGHDENLQFSEPYVANQHDDNVQFAVPIPPPNADDDAMEEHLKECQQKHGENTAIAYLWKSSQKECYKHEASNPQFIKECKFVPTDGDMGRCQCCVPFDAKERQKLSTLLNPFNSMCLPLNQQK